MDNGNFTTHPVTLQDKAAMAAMRAIVEPNLILCYPETLTPRYPVAFAHAAGPEVDRFVLCPDESGVMGA